MVEVAVGWAPVLECSVPATHDLGKPFSAGCSSRLVPQLTLLVDHHSKRCRSTAIAQRISQSESARNVALPLHMVLPTTVRLMLSQPLPPSSPLPPTRLLAVRQHLALHDEGFCASTSQIRMRHQLSSSVHMHTARVD
eukprot:1803489-Amphidinium_carterae.1